MKFKFLCQFWLAQLAEDNTNNNSSSSTTLPNLSSDEACCNNDVSRGTILCLKIRQVLLVIF